MVGCPAIGSSAPGVKMRIRMSVPGVSAGSRNVLSEKFISRVMVCICSGRQPARVGKHGQLIALEGLVGEHVVVQVLSHGASSHPGGCHCRPRLMMRSSSFA